MTWEYKKTVCIFPGYACEHFKLKDQPTKRRDKRREEIRKKIVSWWENFGLSLSFSPCSSLTWFLHEFLWHQTFTFCMNLTSYNATSSPDLFPFSSIVKVFGLLGHQQVVNDRDKNQSSRRQEWGSRESLLTLDSRQGTYFMKIKMQITLSWLFLDGYKERAFEGTVIDSHVWQERDTDSRRRKDGKFLW